MSTLLKNGLLVVLAFALGIVVMEGLSRLVLSPVDFLLPEMEAHAELNHRISPYSAGHDSLGFRNESVPEKVSVVAIGDSMTYGVAASHRDSWPRQLQRLIGQPVYNLALGGYGPVHYWHLLNEFALPMEPDLVIVGVYFGNDLMDAYNLVYSNDSWEHLRRPGAVDGVDSKDLIELPVRSKRFGDLRNWLAHKSMIYRVVTQSALANPVRRAEVAHIHSDVMRIDVPGGITFLTPGIRSGALDLTDPNVQEGLDLSAQALDEIQKQCRARQVDLLVLLIPTKEYVYRDIVFDRGMDLSGSSFRELIDSEERVKARVRAQLDSSGVAYLDLLEPMRAAAARNAIFPENDGHPNALGYSVIATEVSNWIDRQESVP